MELLSQICILQKTYGKTRDEMETMVEGFAWALAGFEISEIRDAMKEYILENPDVPAPAQILKIIKEKRDFADVVPADIPKLLSYRDKGIKLTPAQRKMLARYETQDESN